MNTLLLKLKNPLGIKYDPENQPMGCVGSVGGYVKFAHISHGLIAGMKVLRSYSNDGLRSVEEMGTRWAIEHGYDAKETVYVVCTFSDCRHNTPIIGKWSFAMMLRALALVESGMVVSIGDSWNSYDSVFLSGNKGKKPTNVLSKK